MCLDYQFLEPLIYFSSPSYRVEELCKLADVVDVADVDHPERARRVGVVDGLAAEAVVGRPAGQEELERRSRRNQAMAQFQ